MVDFSIFFSHRHFVFGRLDIARFAQILRIVEVLERHATNVASSFLRILFTIHVLRSLRA